MLSQNKSREALRQLFKKRKIVDLDHLFKVLDTNSRMSVFRRLKPLGYLSSYTHAGRYYTLEGIPLFDSYGLWFFQGVGFSRFGTLKSTIVELINTATAGHTHEELENLLRLRVHNALLTLVRAQQIRRKTMDRRYLYLSINPERAEEQMDQRRAVISAALRETPGRPDPETVILVLLEALNAGKVLVPPQVVSKRLNARGKMVSAEQVVQIFAYYGLEAGKKTAEPA